MLEQRRYEGEAREAFGIGPSFQPHINIVVLIGGMFDGVHRSGDNESREDKALRAATKLLHSVQSRRWRLHRDPASHKV